MIKADPIIAVKDVPASSKWYQRLLDCRSIHEGDQFGVLVDEGSNVIVCLHKWGEHDHPTLTKETESSGNGLLLYMRTDKLEAIRANAETLGAAIEKDVEINPNTQKREFSLRDLDGYYLTFSEYHVYAG